MSSSDTLPSASPRARRGAGRLTWEALGKVHFALDGAGAFVAGLVANNYLPGPKIPLWVVVSGSIMVLVVVIALVLALLRSVEATDEAWEIIQRERDEHLKAKPTRSVKAVVSSYPPYPPCSCILIVSWSNAAALAVGTGVTIAIAEETHEHPLGFGTVRAIQEDGNAVVTLDTPHGRIIDHISKLLDKGTGADHN